MEPSPDGECPIPSCCGSAFSRLLKNSRRSRCQRHGPGCKASRRRRYLGASSRSDNTADGAVPRQPIRAQGVGGHLLCCGSSTMAPHRPPRRASHMAPQASCARPMRVFQQPVRRRSSPCCRNRRPTLLGSCAGRCRGHLLVLHRLLEFVPIGRPSGVAGSPNTTGIRRISPASTKNAVRRSLEPRAGRVAARFLGSVAMDWRRATNRAMASSRFCSWLRRRWALRTTFPSFVIRWS